MVGPFIFLDHFGPIVFGAGRGANIGPHPHIGLSTLSYLLQGEIIHRDSLGNVQSIHAGDVNWMTAGSGIIHSERSPPAVQAQGGTLFGQQIWVALPKVSEEMQPMFSHHAAGTLPEIEGDGVSLTVIAGQANARWFSSPVMDRTAFETSICSWRKRRSRSCPWMWNRLNWRAELFEITGKADIRRP
ncbi:MAG: pirin-related protein [Gammaproteobacteria bacterium]|nr:pirin-related protein [Gammaproteobacteria bacterium]